MEIPKSAEGRQGSRGDGVRGKIRILQQNELFEAPFYTRTPGGVLPWSRNSQPKRETESHFLVPAKSRSILVRAYLPPMLLQDELLRAREQVFQDPIFGGSGISVAIPDNQWEIEVDNLFNTSLAFLQHMSVEQCVSIRTFELLRMRPYGISSKKRIILGLMTCAKAR